ncbi:MipA/OmpV family protein [Niveispirillum sp. KHB5.9]|uniref:MipA/OmpV family protein n=1 Tax=Niveispirillum sp. KHB5.9 TaxID=3400269 RepID=UPI003A8C2FF7
MRVPILLLSAACLITAPAAMAEDAPQWSGFVALGGGLKPEYAGADKYEPIPFAVVNLEKGPYLFEMTGLTARAGMELVPGLYAGPVVGFDMGRDDDVDSKPVARLDKIDSGLDAGGFVGVRFGGNQYGQGEVGIDLTALFDMSDVHSGMLLTAELSYAALRRQQWFVNLDAQATYADASYTRTFFGVTAAEAGRSGLTAYRPGSGLRDIGAGVTVGYQFNQNWGVMGRLSYDYLVGDAADSPIVKDEGSRHQGLAGLAISYRF